MRWGVINLFCSICGQEIRLNMPGWHNVMHHNKFGYVCDKECLDKAEHKYAKMILGNDDE